jgi:tetratricopeptide (TPR) repeat protein
MSRRRRPQPPAPPQDPLDFEIEFFDQLLARIPDHAEALRAQAGNLTAKGRLADGLEVDRRLVRTRPNDPTAHYRLACRYALLRQADLALRTLRRAVELGFRDFGTLRRDRDLDPIRKDPRFRSLLRELALK